MTAETSASQAPGTVTPAPPTLRDDLAALVARCIREGNLTMAKALLDAQIATPNTTADVVSLDAMRRRR